MGSRYVGNNIFQWEVRSRALPHLRSFRHGWPKRFDPTQRQDQPASAVGQLRCLAQPATEQLCQLSGESRRASWADRSADPPS